MLVLRSYDRRRKEIIIKIIKVKIIFQKHSQECFFELKYMFFIILHKNILFLK